MVETVDNLIVGQGLAGTALAWQLQQAGQSLVIVDRGEPATASRVSAGLVTPWTGRRMSRRDDFSNSWQEAVAFYRTVEQQLGQKLFREQPMLRLFVTRRDEAIFRERCTDAEDSELKSWQGPLQRGGPDWDGCEMAPAGRLDVRRYLSASADYFSDQGQWYQMALHLQEDLIPNDDGVHIPRLDLQARRVIFCQGFSRNPWFVGIPDNPSRGDILNVSVDGLCVDQVMHHSVWAAPERDGSLTVGATYDWTNLHSEPLAEGRREVLRSLRRFLDGEMIVQEHRAAVRPTMKDYNPVVGVHPERAAFFVLNGLGSHGSLLAPRLSRVLVESFSSGQAIVPAEWNPVRGRQPVDRRPLTQLAQQCIEQVLLPGDTAVDGTVGNGFDTCFLAEQTGPSGSVLGFDVQQQALESTTRRLQAAALRNVTLIHDSHENLAEHVSVPVKAAMFNLGYLPRADHTVITQPASTLAALQQVWDLLLPGGVLTILAYRGHDGGPEESAAVEQWLQQKTDGTVERFDSQPPRESSPVLFVLRRQGDDDRMRVEGP